MGLFKAGMIGIIAIILISYGAYTKFANPFASKYTVHAIFASANGLRPDSLVRIAGVNVGKVTSVQTVSSCKVNGLKTSQCQAANVTMTIDDNGLPIHMDATFYIRPRIFLEGNFFIDVRPGNPSSPTASDGYVFPIQQGVEPVQIDQVLTSLQGDTRHNLQILLQQFGKAVKQAGDSYNGSIRYWLPAYEYSSIVAHDALGIQPHDLSGYIDKGGVFAAALDAHPQNLKSLITDLNTTAGAFARQQAALAQTVFELPRTLSAAIPAFNALNTAFPPLRAFAKAFLPGVVSSGPAIDASLPFLAQLRQLVQPSELGGFTSDLAVSVPALAKLTVTSIPFMRDGVRPAASCVVNNIYPWSQLTLNDPHFTAANGFPPRKVFVEGVDFLPGLAGESRNFDANGPYVRILGALGDTATYSLQSGLIGGSLAPIIGQEPKVPPNGHRPPLQPNTPCETQPALTSSQLETTSSPGPAKLSADHLSAAQTKFAQSATKALVASDAKGFGIQTMAHPFPQSGTGGK
jgi:virulence factor Mce-like protein